MNQQLLERLLIGDKEAIDIFGESDNCAVIDWHAGVPEIVETVASFLPLDYMKLEQTSPTSFLLHAGGRFSQPIELSSHTRQESLISLVNALLAPDFELRQFKPCDGDPHSLYVAATDVWKKVEHLHPLAVEKFFLSAPRLAVYWQRGYHSRLFSRP